MKAKEFIIEKTRLDPKCWTGYKKQGTKMKGDTRVNNCVPVKEEETGNVDDADSWESQAADAARNAETNKMSQQDATAGGVAEDREYIPSGKKRITWKGIDLVVRIDGATVDIRAMTGDSQMAYVVFYRDGDTLVADDLAVEEQYKGQGIAKIMYDYVKGLGFIVKRSSDQLVAGKKFWDKNKGAENNIWEQGVAEGYSVTDFNIRCFESWTDYSRFLRSPKTSNRDTVKSWPTGVASFLSPTGLVTESKLTQGDRSTAKKFSADFKALDKRELVKIKVGNSISVMYTIIDLDRKEVELGGFVTPKTITNINLNQDKAIDTITFEDGSQFPERNELTNVGGQNITNTIFFPDRVSSSRAYTHIWMLTNALEGRKWTINRQSINEQGVAEDGTWGMMEETYHGNEFDECYGDMWFNEDDIIDEAEYHGRKVTLGKPMQGDVKKFKVYVKDPTTGNIKKVNFGDPNMRIKKSNPARRRSFRARHNCDNPGPRTKARYWSCRKW